MSLRIFLSGCCGRMGRMIRTAASESSDLVIVAGSDLKPAADEPFPVFADMASCDVDFDVLIDFSHPKALDGLLRTLRNHPRPAVFCTTGYTDSDLSQIRAAAAQMPVFQSANMSLGINVLIDLACQAARRLYPDFDLELVEAHHARKLDAPSGTALLIANAVRDSLGGGLELVTDRSERRRERPQAEIGLSSIRGGTIVGDHTIIFAGSEETIEITHRAQSRAVFARGALAAARFIAGQPNGFYTMKELLQSSAG